MATQLQLRRGNTSQTNAFTGAVGEITADTEKKTVVLHDGSTAGGFPLAKETHAQAAFDTANNAGSNASVVASYDHANAAYVQANTGTQYATSAGSYANSAFVAANTADQKAVSAGSYANSAYTQSNIATQYAQSAGDYANSAFAAANNAVDTWVRDASNSASSYANSAFIQANSANITAQAAFDAANNAVDTWVRDAANSASSYANSAYAAANNKLDLTGGTITGDLSVAGNLTVSGNTIQIDVTTLNVTDPIIYLAANNYDSDLVGIGFAGNYNDGTTDRHAGLVRMEASNTFYLFTNYDEEFDTNTLNIANPSLYQAELRANVTANTVVVRNVEVLDRANAAFVQANTGTILAQAAFNAANNAVDTWVRDAANSASSYANSGYTHANAAFEYANNITTVSVGVNITLDTFTGDNSCTTFTLSTTPINENYTSVVIDGVAQLKTAYNISGSDIVFSEAPGTSTNIEVTTYQGADVYASNTLSQIALDHANAAFDVANNATDTWVRNAANAASSYANAAFVVANTASTLAQAAYDAANNAVDTWVRDAANSASSYANGAFVGANTADQKAVSAGSYANSAYIQANSASSYANGAFVAANTADQKAVSAGSYANAAYDQANTATQYAQSAGDYANSAFAAANNAVDTWVRDASNSASSYANSAFVQANTGTILAQAAFDAANNAVDTWVRDAANSASSYANGAFAGANTADQRAVTSGSYANSAYIHANAAFAAANSAGGSGEDTYAREHANAAFDTANTALGGQELYVASLDNFSSNGQNTVFTLSVTPANVSSMFVYVDGVYQQASAYTLDGNTLTMSEAIDANSTLEVRVLANTTPSQLFPTAFNTVVDNFSGDGSTTEFTLSTTPIDENHTFVFLNGVYQEKSTYSISGANVVLTGTATSNDTIEVATVKGSEINVTSSQYNSRLFTGDSACTEFTIASGHSANSILVFENGICQEPITDYTVSGTTLTFTTAPATGVKIQIRELPV